MPHISQPIPSPYNEDGHPHYSESMISDEDYDDDGDHECPTSYILLNDKINKIFYHQYIKNKCPTSLNKSPDLGFYISNLSLTCTSESVAFILGFETNFYYNKN